jgi:hypothetical protein
MSNKLSTSENFEFTANMQKEYTTTKDIAEFGKKLH